jgi:hypothetical protein
MTTARDQGTDLEPLAETRQPLGFLPTRRFWEDPENKRLAYIPMLIALCVSFFTIFLVVDALIILAVWKAVFSFLAMTAAGYLVYGLFERYIRRAAKRRFRSNPKELTGSGGNTSGSPQSVYDLDRRRN